MNRKTLGKLGLALAAAAAVCMLGLLGPREAVSQQGSQPFANAIEQRAEMISLLKEIRDLLREQKAGMQPASPPGKAPPAGGIR